MTIRQAIPRIPSRCAVCGGFRHTPAVAHVPRLVVFLKLIEWVFVSGSGGIYVSGYGLIRRTCIHNRDAPLQTPPQPTTATTTFNSP